ncbi:MAG: single-stranded DNA-binding protein [Bacillota bacterium]
MMNRIILIGRLTKDPDLRYTPSGVAVASFTLAVDRPFTNQAGERETDFINIVVWRKQAENCGNYLSKGQLAAVEGRLQIRTYEAQDGQKRWVTEVVADRVQFLEKKKGDKDQGASHESAEAGENLDEMNLDDLPF